MNEKELLDNLKKSALKCKDSFSDHVGDSVDQAYQELAIAISHREQEMCYESKTTERGL